MILSGGVVSVPKKDLHYEIYVCDFLFCFTERNLKGDKAFKLFPKLQEILSEHSMLHDSRGCELSQVASGMLDSFATGKCTIDIS